MSNELQVKVTSRTSEGQEWWEATASLEGVKPTKIARKSDGNTKFTTRAAVVGAARRLSERYGYTGVDFGEKATVATAQTKTTLKKAAKKAVATTPSTAQ